MNKIELKGLSIGYKKTLVRDIHLSIEEGKLITLLGENGSGKSTLMKTLLKLIQPIDGQITFNGENINNFSAKEWSKIFSVVFSRVGQIPQIKVDELIEIGANNIDLKQKKNIVNWLGVQTLLPKYANQISDGQLQKVMIARALMQDTPFVFFDEPTAHLDFKNKANIYKLLKCLVLDTRKTFIVITHEVLHALHLSDEVWLVQDEKLYTGTAKEINQQFNLEKEVLKYTQHGS